MSKNTIPMRKDSEAVDLLKELRNERIKLGTDKDPVKLSRLDLAVARYIKKDPKAKDFIVRSILKWIRTDKH